MLKRRRGGRFVRAGGSPGPGRGAVGHHARAATAGAPPAIRGVAEALPFDDGSFDAAMAIMTVHQWPDLDRGLSELRRVSRGPVLVVAGDGEWLPRFWLTITRRS